MRTLANIEDPDKMPHNVVFHQGLHCLLRQNKDSCVYGFDLKSCRLGYFFQTCGPCNSEFRTGDIVHGSLACLLKISLVYIVFLDNFCA